MDFIKAVLSLEPWAWLVIFGMFLITVGVLGTIPYIKERTAVGPKAKATAVVLGTISVAVGLWMYSTKPRDNSWQDSPPLELTPQAKNAAIAKISEYASYQLHKAIAVSNAGHIGISANQQSEAFAKQKAWTWCKGFAKAEDPCWVVYVDDKKIGTW